LSSLNKVKKQQGTKLKLLDKKLKTNKPSIGIYENTKRYFFKRPPKCVIYEEHRQSRNEKAYKLMRKK